MRTPRRLVRPVAGPGVGLLLAGALLVGCGGNDGNDGNREAAKALAAQAAQAADQTRCRADVEALDAPYDAAFPEGWSFPEGTTVYDVEDRQGVGVIVTAVSSAPFTDVLDHLNHRESGVTITDGETEENDAEATWRTDGYTGRWAIRKSGTCAGETVIQVLAVPS